ncbi:unnamed protein product [Prorocentrum cordatum]|uniref:Uncharacterized protein n=1 Tax=Prorocentrum cordatum TaxID=2364126 RepID=A0ABN9Q8D9_9DINO|nr:unnamed protein product [Polarella glacialis]
MLLLLGPDGQDDAAKWAAVLDRLRAELQADKPIEQSVDSLNGLLKSAKAKNMVAIQRVAAARFAFDTAREVPQTAEQDEAKAKQLVIETTEKLRQAAHVALPAETEELQSMAQVVVKLKQASAAQAAPAAAPEAQEVRRLRRLPRNMGAAWMWMLAWLMRAWTSWAMGRVASTSGPAASRSLKARRAASCGPKRHLGSVASVAKKLKASPADAQCTQAPQCRHNAGFRTCRGGGLLLPLVRIIPNISSHMAVGFLWAKRMCLSCTRRRTKRNGQPLNIMNASQRIESQSIATAGKGHRRADKDAPVPSDGVSHIASTSTAATATMPNLAGHFGSTVSRQGRCHGEGYALMPSQSNPHNKCKCATDVTLNAGNLRPCVDCIADASAQIALARELYAPVDLMTDRQSQVGDTSYRGI